MAGKSAGTKTVATKAKAPPLKFVPKSAQKSAPVKSAAQKEGEAPEKEAAEATPDAPLPLLDLSDAAVKKMIKQAKKRGYVTYEQLNAVMPSEEVTSEQIEDVLAMMSEMGINVVETEEAEADEEGEGAREEPEEEETESGELVEVTPKTPAKTEAKEPSERTDDPVRMYLREMGSVELLVPRGRDRHRQAHRGRPRGDDCRPVREPADLPGRHHLARRTQRRQSFPARHHRSGSDLCRPRRQEHRAAGPAARRRRSRRACGRRAGLRPAADGSAAIGAARRHSVQAGGATAAKARMPPPKPLPKPTWTKTIWKIPCRLRRSRPSSSRRCWRPSTPSPTSSSGCAACKSRTSITSCTRPAR